MNEQRRQMRDHAVFLALDAVSMWARRLPLIRPAYLWMCRAWPKWVKRRATTSQ